MSSLKSAAPDGVIFALGLTTTPKRLSEDMVTAGFVVDRSKATCNWARTAELRVVCDQAFSYIIIGRKVTDPAAGGATYRAIAANTAHTINVIDAHEKVYFKTASTATLTCELLGSQDAFSATI